MQNLIRQEFQILKAGVLEDTETEAHQWTDREWRVAEMWFAVGMGFATGIFQGSTMAPKELAKVLESDLEAHDQLIKAERVERN